MIITNLILKHVHPRTFVPQLLLVHTDSCSTRKPRRCESSPYPATQLPKRAEHSGKVRFGFIPDEWFLFFHPITGVTGPYFFGIMLTNYALSKEKYVLEHEYYLGVSIFLVIYYVTTRFGRQIGKSLDKEVDEYASGFEKARNDEINLYQTAVNDGKDAQSKAKAQKLLMDAKKENVAMQLEAAYRERMMLAYRSVKSRLDYQVKLQHAQNRIHQKWMLTWILDNVKKAITPEFEKQILDKAMQDIAVLADKTIKASK